MAKYDYKKLRKELLMRSMRYANGVSTLYDTALGAIAREFALTEYDPDIVFSFENYGKFGRIDSIMSRLEEQIQQVVNTGIETEFAAAYKEHDSLISQILGKNIRSEVSRAFAPMMTSGNAAKIFQRENEANNITRSLRVWNGATLGQMETAVQEALMDGMPAKQMAGLIEKYLNDPESCFRRFRIKTGVDADGKSMYGRKWKKRVRNEDGSTSWFDADPRDYPVGQGVYHSSYKNALRYTRTTTNIAYRTADYERYQTEDFVIGIEIHITGNPTHEEDICDLLQGKYPKDFKWTGWHPNCYSDDTEVYTKDGWKLFKDVKKDDFILSLNPMSRDLEYVPILLNISRQHKGKMVHFFNRSYSQLVTPEHDVLCVSKQDGRTFRRLKAEKCGKSQPVYRSSEWRGKKIESVSVGGLNVTFNLFAEFMGYWLSDGSLGHKWEINIAQTDDNRNRIYDCIKKLGMKPRYNGGLVSFNNKNWYEYLQQFGKAADKYMPQEIKDSNADGIKVFLDAFVLCDGHKRKSHAFVGSHGNVCQSKEEERIYFTSSKRMADDIGELILKIGRRPSFKVRRCAGKKHKFRNGTYTINYDHYVISECRSQYATQYNKEYVDYDGMVYDITLAKNNTLYIRRNGKCFWGSNCMCYQIPILASADEVNAMADAIANGEDTSTVPVEGRITDVPDNFKEWVDKNAARIVQSNSLPYFIRDNAAYVASAYHEKAKSSPIGDITRTSIAIVRYIDRDPRLSAIVTQLMDDEGLSQMEQAILISNARSIIADITHQDLRKMGIIGDDMILSRVERNYIVQPKATYRTKYGTFVSVDEVKMDMLIYKDKNGMEFAYPVGSNENSVTFSAITASEIVNDLPPFLRKKISRVSFYNFICPADKYWKIEYDEPLFVSAATDGGKVSFWGCIKGYDAVDFRKIILHEATHSLDGGTPDNYKISTSPKWREAVDNDVSLKRGYNKGYPTGYAKKSYSEDFAESMMMYMQERQLMQNLYPNRSAFIRDLIHKLGKSYR